MLTCRYIYVIRFHVINCSTRLSQGRGIADMYMSSPHKRKLQYGAAGAFLGISVYKKMGVREKSYFKNSLLSGDSIHSIGRFYDAVSTTGGEYAFSKFAIVNLCLVGLFLFVKLVKWTIFGQLTRSEIRNLRDKVSYTAWEFCLGFVVFYYKETWLNQTDVDLLREILKYGGLFSCVLLIKCFHYLADDRVNTIRFPSGRIVDPGFLLVRFTFGLILLNSIDVLLIWKFCMGVYDTFYSETTTLPIKDNILVAIFGFEILNIFPLLLLTMLKCCLHYYENLEGDEINMYVGVQSTWTNRKLKTLHIAEFLVNFLRFIMVCLFASVFLYFYTFPLHIIPSSYISLRVLLLKTRGLIDFKKKQLAIEKLKVPEGFEKEERCIICFEDFCHTQSESTRQLENCKHVFHCICLKNWSNYSNSCPTCRKTI